MKHLPLKAGNYWVYELIYVDSFGVEFEHRNEYDTLRIIKDSVVNGNTYYYCSAPFRLSFPELVRDSMGILVSLYGGIYFKESRQLDTFANHNLDTLYSFSEYVDPGPFMIETHAGTFNCVRMGRYFYQFHPLFGHMHEEKRHNKSYFARDIGMISNEYSFATSEIKWRFKLYDYHLEP